MTLFPTFRRDVLQKLPPKQQQQYVSPVHGANTPKQTAVLPGSRHIFVAVTIACRTDYPGFESLQRKEIYFFSRTSILALGPIQPHMECVPGFFPGGKAVGSWSWPLNVYLVPSLSLNLVKRLLPTVRLHDVDWGNYFFFMRIWVRATNNSERNDSNWYKVLCVWTFLMLGVLWLFPVISPLRQLLWVKDK